jgi:hypothetical protein
MKENGLNAMNRDSGDAGSTRIVAPNLQQILHGERGSVKVDSLL